jgi:hypothetical protein
MKKKRRRRNENGRRRGEEEEEKKKKNRAPGTGHHQGQQNGKGYENEELYQKWLRRQENKPRKIIYSAATEHGATEP